MVALFISTKIQLNSSALFVIPVASNTVLLEIVELIITIFARIQ
jgi:hypothetical protein